MHRKIKPTAVITCNNLLTKGYLQAVCEHTHGKTDLYTHIGLDEIDMMQYLGIPYNCIQRDAYELGRSAAELLMKRIEQPEYLKAYQHRMILSSPLIHRKKRSSEKVLEVKDLSAKGFEHINFDLHAGEILGIAGQLGSGRTELSLALFGMLKPTGGSICISGKEVKLKNVAEAQKQGIALVPEDRLTEGLFLPQPIYKNIAVTSLKELSGALGSVKESAQKELSEHWVKEIGVATKDHTLPVQTLSGGNQQKVVLARWLATHPKILILNGPTVGVDIGAKYDIHKLLRELAKQGMAVLVVSDDVAEITALCDRALIMKAGSMTGEFKGEDLTDDNLYKSTI